MPILPAGGIMGSPGYPRRICDRWGASTIDRQRPASARVCRRLHEKPNHRDERGPHGRGGEEDPGHAPGLRLLGFGELAHAGGAG